MGNVVGDMLPLAIGVAIGPVPVMRESQAWQIKE
jgi:hypothetical protein